MVICEYFFLLKAVKVPYAAIFWSEVQKNCFQNTYIVYLLKNMISYRFLYVFYWIDFEKAPEAFVIEQQNICRLMYEAEPDVEE